MKHHSSNPSRKNNKMSFFLFRHLRQHMQGSCACGVDPLAILDHLEKSVSHNEKVLASNGSVVRPQDAVGCVLHKGKPPGEHECSRCRSRKDHSSFRYYKCRIDKKGYLMRVNALCDKCDRLTSQERKRTLQKEKEKIPPRPSPGDTCPQCKRAWGTKETPRNWHRDHDAIHNKFRRWLCGDCNMANHDHRHNVS